MPNEPRRAPDVVLAVDGARHQLDALDAHTTLLDCLRDRLHLTGAKKGCGHGQCGACTVLVDGARVLSCLTLAVMQEGRQITTVAGLAAAGGAICADPDALHPMQAAFIAHDAFQCGYCTPGQIVSAVAVLDEARRGDASYVTADLRPSGRPVPLSDDEIRERMSGNLCRCGAYANIVAAIREVDAASGVAGGGT
ncbi:aldehyde dehydrogenase iron-sulfur subunit [Gemmatimonadetes bacterium T265]|nr:aldehyde dehydrogenase iron-sulfur subunit [Gemmatimonadetes bacterium T265]